MPEKSFVSVEHFAAIVDLSSRSVWRLVAEGHLPSLKVGRRRLLPLGACIQAIEDRGKRDRLERGLDASNLAVNR